MPSLSQASFYLIGTDLQPLRDASYATGGHALRQRGHTDRTNGLAHGVPEVDPHRGDAETDPVLNHGNAILASEIRSEERRVGKECRL